jgi:hypothetical protein
MSTREDASYPVRHVRRVWARKPMITQVYEMTFGYECVVYLHVTESLKMWKIQESLTLPS